MRKEWNMRREANAATAEIRIYGDIGEGLFDGTSAKQFADQLQALGDLEALDVRINSWGGIATDGIAIYYALERHPATVTVHVDAMAASAASIVAMAASPGRLWIAPAARIMVHPAWTAVVGNRHDFTHQAETLEQLDRQIAGIYAKRTGRREATMLALMDAHHGGGSYFTGQEAVDEGFADRVANEPSALAAPPLCRALQSLRLPPGAVPGPAAAEPVDEAEQIALAVAMAARKARVDEDDLAAEPAA